MLENWNFELRGHDCSPSDIDTVQRDGSHNFSHCGGGSVGGKIDEVNSSIVECAKVIHGVSPGSQIEMMRV